MKVILEMAFQHIAQRFESWIEFLWPSLVKLHKNAFEAATRSSDVWQHPTVGGNYAVGLEIVGENSHVSMLSLCNGCVTLIRYVHEVRNICMHNMPMVLCVRIYMHILLCAHFCYQMVHCGIWDWCIVGFVRWVYYTSAIETTLKEVVNSLTPSAAYMHQRIRSALVQIMACCLFGAKPLSKPMLGYYGMGPSWNKFQGNFNQNIQLFIYENASENTVCKMVVILQNGGHELTHWPLDDMDVIFKKAIFNLVLLVDIFRIILW